jgi:hypothetical protein
METGLQEGLPTLAAAASPICEDSFACSISPQGKLNAIRHVKLIADSVLAETGFLYRDRRGGREPDSFSICIPP